ncbi:MAG: STAS domain-containing protein [Clostridia bacterium]
MIVKYVSSGDTLSANFYGELDECSAEKAREGLDNLLEDLKTTKYAKFIFDFSNLTFMDSTGIGVIIGRYNKFKNYPIEFFIKGADSHVDRILGMTGIYNIIPKIS